MLATHVAAAVSATRTVPLGTIFVQEFLGTAVLITLGVGVVANHLLPRSKGEGGGNLMVNVGWGIGVMAGVYVAYQTGAHLSPAVTLGLLAAHKDFAPGIPPQWSTAGVYIAAQLLGAIVGACAAWLAYRRHYDLDAPAEDKLGTFATVPAIRSYADNFLTEVVATFVLLLVIIGIGKSPAQLGALPVMFLVIGIGASLGGPTGYAINPARDLGPRIAHAFLPIKGKGGSDWGYAWVPIAGPIVGAVLAGLLSRMFL